MAKSGKARGAKGAKGARGARGTKGAGRAKGAKGAARAKAGSAKAKSSKARGAKAKGARKSGAARGGGGRRPNAAFMRPVTPSPQLSEIIGSKPVPRTEVTKRLWAYIKRNDLQDQRNKRMINADGALKSVFGGKSTVNMFEMTKLVNKHLK